MSTPVRRFARADRVLTGVVVLATLLLVVALASRGHVGRGGEATRGPSDQFWNYVITVGIVLYGALFVTVAYAMWIQRGAIPLQRAPWMKQTFVGMILFSLVFAGLALYVQKYGRLPWERNRTPSSALPTGTVRPADGNRPKHYEPEFEWLPAGIVLGLAAGGIAFYLIRRPQPRGRLRRPSPLAGSLADLLAEALQDLREEADPRRAVIATYARMERTLRAFGLPRRPAEAPLEYLERVLIELHASADSVSRLTELFEWAKFSSHPIDAAQKEEAITALETVRDELREVA